MVSPTIVELNWSALSESILGVKADRPVPPWVKLPSPPVALLRCIQAAQDPHVGPADLAVIIASDAGLSCQILRRVNSAAETLSKPANTVTEALARLGIRRSVMYLTTECMKQAMPSKTAKLLNVGAFAASNFERALFAKHLARAMHTDEELAFSAALIADCLMPVITNQAFRSYLRFLEGQLTKPRTIVEFEKKEFGWTHPFMTATIFAGWGFPDDLVCCVGLHHAGHQLLKDPQLRRSAAAAVAIAGLIPDQMKQEPDGVQTLANLVEYQIDIDVMSIATKIEAEFREHAPALKHDFPLIRRLSKKNGAKLF